MGSEGGGGGAASLAAWGGGGGGLAGARAACPPPSWWPWGGGRRCAPGGDRRRGGARLLRAAEMRPNTSGSDAGGRRAWGGGGGGLGGVLPRRGLLQGPRLHGGRGGGSAPVPRPAPLAGTGGGLLPPPTWRRSHVLRAGGECQGGRSRAIAPPPPPAGRGDRGCVAPPPAVWCDIPPGTPRIARLGVWRFAGLEEPRSKVGGGRVPSTLGGAAPRRAAGGPESGRACDAGRARPSQEDNAAAPRPSGLGYKHLAARCDPGRGHRAARAPREARVAYVASPAAAADAQAQAPAAGTRRRPVLEAERALRAAARYWGAAALRRRERDAAGQAPRGPSGIG